MRRGKIIREYTMQFVERKGGVVACYMCYVEESKTMFYVTFKRDGYEMPMTLGWPVSKKDAPHPHDAANKVWEEAKA